MRDLIPFVIMNSWSSVYQSLILINCLRFPGLEKRRSILGIISVI